MCGLLACHGNDKGGPTCTAQEAGIPAETEGCVVGELNSACESGGVWFYPAGPCPTFLEYLAGSGWLDSTGCAACIPARCPGAEGEFDVVLIGWYDDYPSRDMLVFDVSGLLVATYHDPYEGDDDETMCCGGAYTSMVEWYGTGVEIDCDSNPPTYRPEDFSRY